MYIPARNLENPEVEIVCLLTGESYVHLEGSDSAAIDQKLLDGAIEALPERFFRTPWAVKKDNGTIKIILPKLT